MAMFSSVSSSKRQLSRRIRRLRRAANDARAELKSDGKRAMRAARVVSTSVSRHPIATLMLAAAGALVGTALVQGARSLRA